MTVQDTNQLIELLQKLKKEGLQPPHTPLEVWHELNSILPSPAVEIIITRTGLDFLLTERRDNNWNGWHIPGGFMLAKESIATACKRVALRELNTPIEFQEIIGTYAWPDHPYASPLSIICICKALEEPKTGKFFTQIPKEIVNHHDEFIRRFLQFTKKGESIR